MSLKLALVAIGVISITSMVFLHRKIDGDYVGLYQNMTQNGTLMNGTFFNSSFFNLSKANATDNSNKKNDTESEGVPSTNGTNPKGYNLSEEGFPCDPHRIANYSAYRTLEKIVIDGKLNEKSWQIAPKSPQFRDIITYKPTIYDTRAAVMWDQDYLYVGFWVQEPNVFGNFTERNSPVWQECDVEVFIAGKDAYYEFEVSPRNTIYEVLFMWEDAYEKEGYSKVPELSRENPETKPWNGVGFQEHPRGPRVGAWAYRLEGLQSATFINGTLNNDTDLDYGWTVEIAFPWKSMTWAKPGGRSVPPEHGDMWRMDFSRFNNYKAPSPPEDSSGWFWSPHGVWDSHIPECFPKIFFSTEDVVEAMAPERDEM